MLDKQKVMQELIKSMPTLFKETSQERLLARELFTWLQNNPQVVVQLQSIESSIVLPSWQGPIDAVQSIMPHEHPYAVVAVDGSQIYPDRHQGMACYLLNTGIAHFVYSSTSSVRLFSVPSLFTQIDDLDMSEEMVNCRRAELEFEVGLQEAKRARELHPDEPSALVPGTPVPSMLLCDGSLIFWHLESKPPRIRDRFLKKYLEQLDAFYNERILIAGFISSPKSKELVALLRLASAQDVMKNGTAPKFDTSIDADIAAFFLKEGQRTTLFTHNSQLADKYPAHLRPCFVYMHVGDEIARIEVPNWIAQDNELLNRVLRIIMDQCKKGNGYPIALAEAHEQAVVNTSDRQFFFEMLFKMAMDSSYRLHASQKSLKKRFVSV